MLWAQAAKTQSPLRANGWRFPIAYPINVAVVVTVSDGRRRDLINMLHGVFDSLVKARILADDNYNIVASHDGSKVIVGENDATEITITPRAWMGA